ncbi:MAG TPA: hypothetical protein VGK02_05500 [Candidatus Aquicultor sp.]|jgi:hypothetical protein
METIIFKEESYKIPIGGEWNLEDLYVFPRNYEQVYVLFYSFLAHKDESTQGRIEATFSNFPWRGGYSAAHFYGKLKYILPKQQRPQVLSLKYASPGWIELSLIIGIALLVQRLVKTIAATIREANSIYNEVYTGLQQRKLLRIEVEKKELELEAQHLEYINQSVAQMSKLMGFEDIQHIHEKTGNPLITLKILLSLYRRVRTLAEYQNNGKIRF